jgi:precorrin-6B methylase 2
MAVECALLLSRGHVLAVDRDRRAVELIRENARLSGAAPWMISRLSTPKTPAFSVLTTWRSSRVQRRKPCRR